MHYVFPEKTLRTCLTFPPIKDREIISNLHTREFENLPAITLSLIT